MDKDMLKLADEEMKHNWKLRWLCRWEVLKLDITEKWYWLFPKSSQGAYSNGRKNLQKL